MNRSTYIILMLLFFVIYMQNSRKKKLVTRRILNKKTESEKEQMMKYISGFIGKECYIKTINDTARATIKDVSEKAILVETKVSTEIINLDYVISVSEIRKDKK